jgi:hypothetical protein
MKMYNKFKTTGLALSMGLFVFACNTETQNETNQEVDEAQVEMTETNRDANREIEEFDSWVSTNTERAENVTAEEYREMRTEYARREAELEAKSANWDDETRRTWKNTKQEWEEFENGVKKRLGDIDVDVDVDRN